MRTCGVQLGVVVMVVDWWWWWIGYGGGDGGELVVMVVILVHCGFVVGQIKYILPPLAPQRPL